jgi:predicted DNA-binding protein
VESIKRVIRALYSPKHSVKSVRFDTPTLILLNELSSATGMTASDVVRLSLWITAVLVDPSTTLRQILSEEAVERLKRGEDVALIDAVGKLGSVLAEKTKRYYREKKW